MWVFCFFLLVLFKGVFTICNFTFTLVCFVWSIVLLYVLNHIRYWVKKMHVCVESPHLHMDHTFHLASSSKRKDHRPSAVCQAGQSVIIPSGWMNPDSPDFTQTHRLTEHQLLLCMQIHKVSLLTCMCTKHSVTHIDIVHVHIHGTISVLYS